MKKLQYKIRINAPSTIVYDRMLGLSNKKSYEEWTAAFHPTSSFEGSWEKGSKIYFIGKDDKGEKSGMLSRIAENNPHQFVSIQHYGLFKGGEEITSGPEVEKWANGFENYTFEELNGHTELCVDLDMDEEFEEHMNTSYPKALQMLKEICEK
jgi:hypothetical protein